MPRCLVCFSSHLSFPKCCLLTVTTRVTWPCALRCNSHSCTQRRRYAGLAQCDPVVTTASLSQARSSSLAPRLEPMMASSQLGSLHSIFLASPSAPGSRPHLTAYPQAQGSFRRWAVRGIMAVRRHEGRRGRPLDVLVEWKARTRRGTFGKSRG